MTLRRLKEPLIKSHADGEGLDQRLLSAVLMTILAVATPAASAQSTSGPASALGAQLLNLTLGLGLVLALIAACAWLVKKLAPRTLVTSGVLRVIAGAAVGQRERVVVVEIGETWLVLGVAAGGVSALHQMPRGAAADAPAPVLQHLPFAAWLKEFKDKRNAR